MFPDVFRHDRRNLLCGKPLLRRLVLSLTFRIPGYPEGIEEFETANDSYRRLISKTPSSRHSWNRGSRRHKELLA